MPPRPLQESAPMKLSAVVCAGVVLLGLGIDTAVAQPPIPYGAVPPPQYEPMPPPRRGHYWEPGHWHWNGHRYIWLNGHWAGGRPRHGEWVQGHWQWNGHRYVWIPAHWQ
jgi:hypothetical protein